MKVIIDIPEEIYQEAIKSGYSHLYDEEVANAVAEGTPLANDSERAEAQVYFDGQAYGWAWEQGRKALIDDLKAEMEKQIERDFAFAETETLKVPYHYGSAGGLQVAVKMLDNISKDE